MTLIMSKHRPLLLDCLRSFSAAHMIVVSTIWKYSVSDSELFPPHK